MYVIVFVCYNDNVVSQSEQQNNPRQGDHIGYPINVNKISSICITAHQ